MDINLKEPITDQFRLQIQRDPTSELYWHLKNTITQVPYYSCTSVLLCKNKKLCQMYPANNHYHN